MTPAQWPADSPPEVRPSTSLVNGRPPVWLPARAFVCRIAVANHTQYDVGHATVVASAHSCCLPAVKGGCRGIIGTSESCLPASGGAQSCHWQKAAEG